MVSLKTLAIQDIGQAIRLSDAEGWNQTEADWELLIQDSRHVCLAAEVEEKIIGTATAINYRNEVAWIGMVLVDKEYRGKGVSKILLSGLFEQLGSCRSVKLDATPAGQPVYQKFGFQNEYMIQRLTAHSISVKTLLFYDELPERIHINEISEIIKYDQQVFGANREQLIKYLYKNEPDNAWVIRQDGKVCGLALGRKGARFYQAGPVLAKNTQDAMKLITISLVGIKDQPIVVDVLEDKKELTDWLISLGFIIQRPFVRMYRNENPFPGIPNNQFLICGPEFG